MRGLIAEIDGRYMVVITEKGDFIKIKREMKYGIGDEIQLPEKSSKRLFRALSTAAASILLCVMLGSGVYAYYTPYSYVSVDINPSLGLSLNRFERVIEVQPLNEDAEKVVSTAGAIKNQHIETALAEYLKSAVKNGYLKTGQENDVMLVVSANAEEEAKLYSNVKAVSVNELSKLSKNYNVIMEKASVEEYKTAVAKNVSPGKVLLAKKIKKSNLGTTAGVGEQMTVKQAMEKIKQERKLEKDAERASKEELKKKLKEKHQVAVSGSDPDNENAGINSNEGQTKIKKKGQTITKSKDKPGNEKTVTNGGKQSNTSVDKNKNNSKTEDDKKKKNGDGEQQKTKQDNKDKTKGNDKGNKGSSDSSKDKNHK